MPRAANAANASVWTSNELPATNPGSTASRTAPAATTIAAGVARARDTDVTANSVIQRNATTWAPNTARSWSHLIVTGCGQISWNSESGQKMNSEWSCQK